MAPILVLQQKSLQSVRAMSLKPGYHGYCHGMTTSIAASGSLVVKIPIVTLHRRVSSAPMLRLLGLSMGPTPDDSMEILNVWNSSNVPRKIKHTAR